MKTRHSILPLIALITTSVTQAAGLTGRDITQKVKNRADDDTRYATAEMALVQKDGHKRVRKIESWAMDEDEGTKKTIFFTYPDDVKSMGLLTWDCDSPGRTGGKRPYLPVTKKTRRIGGELSKIDYFTGSDFTYDDMSIRNMNEETRMLLREEVVNGHKCWVMQSVPKDKGKTYSEHIIWIRQGCLMAIRADYYGKLNKLHRSLTVSSINKVQGFWTIHLMQMENVQTEHKTIIKMDNQRFNAKITPNPLTVSKLKEGP